MNYDFPTVIHKITKTWFRDTRWLLMFFFKILLDFAYLYPDSLALTLPLSMKTHL